MFHDGDAPEVLQDRVLLWGGWGWGWALAGGPAAGGNLQYEAGAKIHPLAQLLLLLPLSLHRWNDFLWDVFFQCSLCCHLISTRHPFRFLSWQPATRSTGRKRVEKNSFLQLQHATFEEKWESVSQLLLLTPSFDHVPFSTLCSLNFWTFELFFWSEASPFLQHPICPTWSNLSYDRQGPYLLC